MKNLEELVAIRSDKDCKKILNYLEGKLKNTSKEVEIFEENGISALICGINTKIKDICPIVLSGHIDTVSADEEKYQTNPYSLSEIDGKAYGLGSIDMKSFIAIVLDKIEEIKQFDVPIILALTTDEETNLKSIELIIEKFKQLKIKPKFTIVGEPTNSEIFLSSNACYEYSIKFYGKACHSSRTIDGINAICACAKFVSFIESCQKNYRLTSNCGIISGGEVVNKVPDFAKLIFDVRSTFFEDIEKFMQDIEEYKKTLLEEYLGLKIEITSELKIPPFNCINNEKITKIVKTLNIKTGFLTGACEAGYYNCYYGDAIIFGVGDLALAHKPNEFVEICEYKAYSNKLVEVLKMIKKYYYK